MPSKIVLLILGKTYLNQKHPVIISQIYIIHGPVSRRVEPNCSNLIAAGQIYFKHVFTISSLQKFVKVCSSFQPTQLITSQMH